MVVEVADDLALRKNAARLLPVFRIVGLPICNCIGIFEVFQPLFGDVWAPSTS